MNNRQASIISRYEASSMTDLYQAYASTSKEKRDAWRDCVASKVEHNGTDLRIIGANGWQFSVGYKFERDGKTYLMYITKSGKEEIPYEEV